jgi:hypothetical protein
MIDSFGGNEKQQVVRKNVEARSVADELADFKTPV